MELSGRCWCPEIQLQVIEGELGDEDEDGQMTSTPIAHKYTVTM